MKKYLSLLLILLLLCACALCSAGSADAETGFGIVNADQVAMRKEPNGQKLYRFDRGTPVWISGSKTDSKGDLWYQITAQYNYRYKRTGWMKAEFIDAGAQLWRDIKKVAANQNGMIALRKDGSVVPLSFIGKIDKEDYSDQWTVDLPPCRDVFAFVGSTHVLTRQNELIGINGTLMQSGIRLSNPTGTISIETDPSRFVPSMANTGDNSFPEWLPPFENPSADEISAVVGIEDNSRCLMLLKNTGEVICGTWNNDNLLSADNGYKTIPVPDFRTVPPLKALISRDYYDPALNLPAQYNNMVQIYAGITEDGKVWVYPEEKQPYVDSWSEITQLGEANGVLYGVRKDGTVVAASLYGKAPLQVSQWTDIVDLCCNGETFIVGIKNDGTLVFAGEPPFSN